MVAFSTIIDHGWSSVPTVPVYHCHLKYLVSHLLVLVAIRIFLFQQIYSGKFKLIRST